TAENIVTLVSPEAIQAGVDLRLEAGDPIDMMLDDERMRQVVFNLLRNAIEATGQGGHVALRVQRRDAHAVLEVEDDGPGLPSPDAPIFEPFFTTKENGTGLGLAISHRIVSDHGGKIGVDSRSGRTVFSLSLPIA